MKRIHSVIVAAAVVTALAACTPLAPTPSSAPPTTTATPTAKPTPAPSPTPTVSVAALAIPDCETLVPIDLARQYLSATTEFIGDQPPGEFVGRESIASIPVVLGTASPSRVCFWGIPNSGGLFWVNVAGITEAERATLQGELTGAGYSETTMGTLTVFELSGENGVGSVGFTHIFTGDVWIWCDGVSLAQSGAMTGQALDALRTLNPSLGL